MQASRRKYSDEKNNFESTDSEYVNTNRKYSLGNFLELEGIDLVDLEPCNTVVSGKQMKNTVWQKKNNPPPKP